MLFSIRFFLHTITSVFSGLLRIVSPLQNHYYFILHLRVITDGKQTLFGNRQMVNGHSQLKRLFVKRNRHDGNILFSIKDYPRAVK